jgi:(2R)-3-sulfolactate dehydrogenase (NADP+)
MRVRRWAGLRHQPAGLLRAPRGTRAVHRRPGLQQHPFVSVRDAAAQGTPLPEGWAVDADGRPTTNPDAALSGALLPFGGYKGANVALFVELLSSMAGGRWSVDAPPWDSGSQSPSLGLFVLGIDHSAIGREFPARAEEHLERLADSGVRLPGSRRTEPPAVPTSDLALRTDVLATLRRRAGHITGSS